MEALIYILYAIIGMITAIVVAYFIAVYVRYKQFYKNLKVGNEVYYYFSNEKVKANVLFINPKRTWVTITFIIVNESFIYRVPIKNVHPVFTYKYG